MGLFDDIKCKMSLPGIQPEFTDKNHSYQTKSLDCEMDCYEIKESGELYKNRVRVGSTETIRFYSANARTWAYGFKFTKLGEDSEEVEYQAVTVGGKVTNLIQISYTRATTLSLQDLRNIEGQIKKDEPKINESEPEIGDSLFIQWGGVAAGYVAKLEMKTAKQWVISNEKGDLELIDSYHLGRTIFHSKNDSVAIKTAKNNYRTNIETLLKKKLAEKASDTKRPK